MIPYGRQDISESDIAAVRDVLTSDFLTQGPQVPAFEERVAKLTGAEHAVAANSATSALHMAYLALGLGEGDLLWTSPNTFVATANAARYCRAEVDFVDIDPATFNMSVQALRDKLEKADLAGRLPKIVVPVHLSGQSADMREIGELAQKYGFRVVEDASHAIGAGYQGSPVGKCDHSDIAVFSFHPVKIITSGEGGMATTNDADLAHRMRLACSHGITRDPTLMSHPEVGPWYYEQIDLGWNYRLTDIQAALGTSQCDRLEEFIKRRHIIADRYDALLDKDLLAKPVRLADRYSSLHLYIIRVHDTSGELRRTVFKSMRSKNIGVNVHYIPVHLQPYYRELGFKEGQFPEAEAYYASAISIPMYPTLDDAKQDYVVEALHASIKTAR